MSEILDTYAAEAQARKYRHMADAARYRRLRSALYGDGLHVGEAVIQMNVVGQCPSTEDIDSAIDAAIALAQGDAA